MGIRPQAVRRSARQGAVAVAVIDEKLVAVPDCPFRGIAPFRYADHAIFFAREEESNQLSSLVAVYRGVMLYGGSGAGKSSLINAALLPAMPRLRLHPERLRVQPRAGEELVVERVATTERGDVYLPSVLAPSNDTSARYVLAMDGLEERLQAACEQHHRPLLIFDQFEELLTLFEEPRALELRRRLVDLLLKLLRSPIPVKLVLSFREDYLAQVKEMLGRCPELVDQALRLAPPAADTLPTIIRGPFEYHPGQFERELTPALADRLCAALAERFGAGEVSLSEVQTVCLRLWEDSDPEGLLAARGIQGILEDYLAEALAAFTPELRSAAIALLGQMVTSAGTRNVIAAEDLVQRVREEDEKMSLSRLERALEKLEAESRLVRRERRRDLYLYEITSEFLVPWISRRRDEARRAQERRRERRRLLRIGGALLVICTVLAILAILAITQANKAREQEGEARSLALSSAAASPRASRPDVPLLLSIAAYDQGKRVDSPGVRAEARGSVMEALKAAQTSGFSGILHGHSGGVLAVAFGPDRRTVASASADGTIVLWDLRSHRPVGRPLKGGHSGFVYDVAFSPDGNTLASVGKESKIVLWDVRTHEQRGPPLRHSGDEFTAVAFRRAHALVSGDTRGRIRVWDTRRDHSRSSQLASDESSGGTDQRPIDDIAISRDGRMLASASGSQGGRIRLWDLDERRQLGAPLGRQGHEGFFGVAFSPDGFTLASAGRDGNVRLWDASTHEERFGSPLPGRHTGIAFSVAFSSDARTLASAGQDETIRLWDAPGYTAQGSLKGHTGPIYDVEFSPDGDTLASASGDTTIAIWNTQRRDRLESAAFDGDRTIRGIAFAPDGRRLAAVGDDTSIRIWDPRTRTVRRTLSGAGDVQAVAVSDDGRWLAAGGRDGVVLLWDLRESSPVAAALRGHVGPVRAVAFSRGGRTLASAGGDGTVRIWSTRTRRQRGSSLEHQAPVDSVSFSPSDRRLVASGDTDGKVWFWDLETHRPRDAALPDQTGMVHAVAFSPDGSILATAGENKEIRLWDARERRPLGSLRGHTRSIYAVAFSPDGRTLASSGRDRSIRLWDVESRRQLGSSLPADIGDVEALAFRPPDGQTLAAGGHDGIRLWNGIFWRDSSALRRRVCRLVGTGLTKDDWAQYAPGLGTPKTCP